MEQSVRFGIIGTGTIAGLAHAPALGEAAGASLWSVLSRSQTDARAFAQKHGARAAFDSLKDFLDDPKLDAVIVASPDGLHAEHILACAEAGKHVLSEKPLATNREAAARAVAACRSKGLKLSVGFHLRWHAGHRELHRHAIGQGALGDIRHVRAHWTFLAADDRNWRAQTEVGCWWTLAATGAHCIDLVRWFLPDRQVEQRTAVVVRGPWASTHDQTALLTWKLAQNATAEVSTSVLYTSPTRLEIYGSAGWAVCEDTFGRHGGGKISINGEHLQFVQRNPFVAQIEDFVQAIRDDRKPEVDGEEGLANMQEIFTAVS